MVECSFDWTLFSENIHCGDDDEGFCAPSFPNHSWLHSWQVHWSGGQFESPGGSGRVLQWLCYTPLMEATVEPQKYRETFA